MVFRLWLMQLMVGVLPMGTAHGVSLSQVDGLRLSADSISRDYETKTIVLEGKVEIAFDDQVLKCDMATIDQKSRDITAQGNVLLASADSVVKGSAIKYNFKTKLGKIENGIVQSGQVAFEGKTLEKTGPNTYFGKEARYTACTTCPPGWSFSGQEIDAEMGGYAYIKYPVLRIADFPIFILPRILIPLKSDRQSGLLVPSLDYSRKGGAAFTQSYFWAISQSKDATISLKKYERQGLKTLLEYRYVLDPRSSGTLQGAYIEDEAYTDNGEPDAEEFKVPRGYFQYRHHFHLPDDVIQRMQLTYVTDLRYPRDFSEELKGHGDPALESNMSFTKNSETQHRSIEGAFYTNLLKNENAFTDEGDALSRNDDAVHRWPEVRWTFTDRRIADSDFYWGLDFNYVHFIRRDFSYDDIDGTTADRQAENTRGEFDAEKDLIRTGHRTIIEPKISYPFHLGKNIAVTPGLKYNETQYRFTAQDDDVPTNINYQQNAARRYVQADLGLQTVFSSVFGGKKKGDDLYKHEIIPELNFSNIPWVERPDHPFFGGFENQPYSRSREAVNTDDFQSANSDTYSGLQFDYKDRLFEKEIYTFRLTNNWVRKSLSGNGDWVYDKVATLRFSQSYDVVESRRNDPKPWSPINMLLDVRLNSFETHTVADFYPYANNLLNWSTRARFIGKFGTYLELTYAEKEFVDSEFNRSNKTENFGTGLGFTTRYMDFTGKASYSVISEELEGWEYIALFKPPGDCWTIKLGHKQTTGSDDVYKFSFNFEFGGT